MGWPYERLGAERFLVRHLERDALVVQRARVVRRVYRAPHLVSPAPRALRFHSAPFAANGLARPTKVRLEAKDRAFLGSHFKNFVIEWFEYADRMYERIDVEIILVALFFGAMQRFLIEVFLARDKDGVLL